MIEYSENRKIIFMMGGLGNILFQLNLAYHLKDLGYKVSLNTFALKRGNFIAKLLNWTVHGTLEDVNRLKLFSDFQVDDKFSIAFLKGAISKKIKIKIVDTMFYGLNSPNESEIKCINNFFGYYHNNNPLNNTFSVFVKDCFRVWLNDHKDLGAVVNKINETNSLVVHIRGGDFTADANGRLGDWFYSKAMLYLSQKFDALFVITNDRDYAKEVLQNFPYEIISRNEAIDDFIILQHAPLKILANSTFSWWAAELSINNCCIIEIHPYYPNLDWRPISVQHRIRINRNIFIN